MLNRRYLRIKAMQHLYALKQCQSADYWLGRDYISEAFEPDFKEEGKRDEVKIAAEKEAALVLYENHFTSVNVPGNEGGEEGMAGKVANEAIGYNENLYKKDLKHLKESMVKETEKIYDWYLLFLQLLVDFADLSTEFNLNETQKKPGPATNSTISNNFIQNSVINILRQNQSFQFLIKEKDLNWNDYRNELKRWFKELIKVDEEFLSYQNIVNPGFDEDKFITDHLVKNLIFKSELLDHFMEGMDLTWQEDKKVVKNMVYKTLNNLNTDDPGALKLRSLSPDWEEDKEFFNQIFKLTADNYETYEKLIADKAQNWAVDRIAAIDNVILCMALSEMINFPGIPVKVTINEYIEMAKKYSTPKSKQFVNGILDVLSKELQENGVIKKSGRGMLDNK